MAITLNGSTGIQNVLGSAAAPSESNTTSSNTGLYFPSSTTLGLSTAGANAVYVDASQNVGIGTTSNLSSRLYIVPSGTNQAAVFAYNSTFEAIDIYNTGNQNFTAIRLLNNNFATVVGSISCSTTSTAYNTSSDYRLKENIVPMTTGLEKISALKPVTYDWISDKSEGEGFIAHELQAIIPHAVTGTKDAVDDEGKPVYQGVDYSKIVVHLVAAIQELDAKFEAYKAAHP